MSTITQPITEADILVQVIDPEGGGLRVESARALIGLRISDRATARMNELAEKNSRNTLTGAEQDEREKYLRVNRFLNLIQAKAHVSLATNSSAPEPSPDHFATHVTGCG